nr:aldehyde dehydrogenase family protein [Salinicola acroporae]
MRHHPFQLTAQYRGPQDCPCAGRGNAVIVKPSEVAPGSTLALVQALLDAGLPPALISVVHGPGETVGQQLLEDPRIDYYTFTGSTAVGKKVRDAAGIRGTQLELGSIASTIICADADLEKAAKKLISGCFRKAGQVCTSVQRLYVHRDVYQKFKETFLPLVESTPWGSPEKSETVVGPMINLDNAKRVHSWIEEAVNAGASLLCGGRRHHNVVEPTVLEFVPTDARLFSQEVFGPVVSLVEYDDLEAAIDSANATPYGLAVGVFTNSLDLPFHLADRLDFGGIHINETSSSRLDVMPFGGVKDSGYGKEGPHYAIRDMTDEKLITIAY